MAFVLDTRQFQQALAQYAAASGRDFADIVNHKLKDAAFRSVKYCKVGDKGAIKRLKAEVKLIAYILRRRAGEALKTPVYFRKTRTGVKTYRGTGRYYTRQEAKDFARRWVAAKGRATSFLKSWFARAARGMASYIRGDGVPVPSDTGKFSDLGIFIQPARPGPNPVGNWTVRYGYRKRSGKTASRIESLLYRALQHGMNEVTFDIGTYVRRKMEQTARTYSAR